MQRGSVSRVCGLSLMSPGPAAATLALRLISTPSHTVTVFRCKAPGPVRPWEARQVGGDLS